MRRFRLVAAGTTRLDEAGSEATPRPRPLAPFVGKTRVGAQASETRATFRPAGNARPAATEPTRREKTQAFHHLVSRPFRPRARL